MACEFARLRGPTWRMLESSSSPSASTTAIVTRRRPRTVGAASFFTMSNSPPRGLATQHISFPRRIFCARVVASCFFVSTASPLHLPALRRARAQILGVSISSDPEMRGPAERREAHSCCRARRTRPHACEACPSRANRDSASRRSTVAFGPGPAASPAYLPEPGQGWLRPAIVMAGYGPGFDRGYGPRPTPHPAPPSGSSPETPLMSEDDKSIL